MWRHQSSIARVTNAHTQANKIVLVAVAADDIAQAVVATMTTADFQPNGARGEIKFIVRHQHLRGRNLEKFASAEVA